MLRVACLAPVVASSRGELGLPARLASNSRHLVFACLLGALAVVVGCATKAPNPNYPRVETTALQDHDSTPLGQEVAQLAALNPGKSGFTLLPGGRQAFTARVALAEMAQRTLDLQYFLWEPDATGRILSDRLLRAADRGVRVRILLDDVNLKDRDRSLAAFDVHPNIEIRIFNPFGSRDSHLAGFLTDFDRVNHRMHNKLMVMDNAVAIVGGRNMGDSYFEVDPRSNFRDLDMAAAGPVVRDLSNVFDRFWNGTWSVPIGALREKPSTEHDLAFYRQRMADYMRTKDNYPHPIDQDVNSVKLQVSSVLRGFIWAPGRVLYDDPESINDASKRTLSRLIFQRVDSLHRELLIESAYFIPLPATVDKIRELRARGIHIRVLTNSLASNDVLAAFAGYSAQREELLRAGVELYEMRPEPGPVRKRLFGTGSKAGLHTKAMVFDRTDVFVGSFNLDNRSAMINTEAGLYVESWLIADQVAAYMDDGVDPENAFRVALNPDGKLFWNLTEEGQPQRFDVDPMSTQWQRMQAGFIRMLPIAEQL
jgi:putative cardiolipin synthase